MDTSQRSVISCNRESGYCMESNAAIYENGLLSLISVPYEISSWTNQGIVTKINKSECNGTTLKIDFINKK